MTEMLGETGFSESSLRLGMFLGVLLLMLAWEWRQPFRHSQLTRRARWPANIGIVVLDTLLVRLLLPAGAVGVAWWAQTASFGLLNSAQLPAWLAIALAMVALDIAIYWQHRLFHHVPWLWRLHRVHHVDQAVDVTTGLRFHPLEIILSMLIKMAVVALIGAPVAAVLLFEVLLNACSLFNHANIQLPHRVERALRWLLITPTLHRVHHSQETIETNSNFGFSVTWWDRLFASYRSRAKQGDDGVSLGIREFRNAQQTNGLLNMLKLPWQRPQK